MEFVNVIIRDTETNEMKGGAVTDIDGRFDIGDLPLNRPLQATYSAMSYTTLTSPVVRLSASKPLFDAGNVVLSTEAHLLETVTITGQKRTIEYSLDRKVVNVEQTLVSEGGSAVDVLQNVPSVSVDEEGNVSMKGSDNVTILIDWNKSPPTTSPTSKSFPTLRSSTTRKGHPASSISSPRNANGPASTAMCTLPVPPPIATA